jgi:Na+:H+ antiporter, NhaA family
LVSRHPQHPPLPAAQAVADRVFATLERFLHVEAVSGVVLLIAAAAAMLWANSAAGHSYAALWHTPVAFGFGDLVFSEPLEFWVNDGLMTIFFLVVGLEIRREMHEGALADRRAATLPIAAALGGIAVPALIYLAIARDPQLHLGWAIPTATDIAFAVGILALLGRAIPGPVRILLLAIAIIDDIAAVLIIALFYSNGFEPSGIAIALAGMGLVWLFQRIGLRAAVLYILPGAILWFGMLRAGVHPTLAGVVLGLMTPVRLIQVREKAVETATRALTSLDERAHAPLQDVRDLAPPLRRLKEAERELLPPVTRVQIALHPWVAYGVMPLFALANAGVLLRDVDLRNATTLAVATSVFAALVLGKPIGIFAASWIAVRSGWCSLPTGVSWRALALVGCLGGIGFTMAIFIATLAFSDGELLAGAKLGIMTASSVAAITGLAFGFLFARNRAALSKRAHEGQSGSVGGSA